QAEDGIRDLIVTGVQTCALPIFRHRCAWQHSCTTAGMKGSVKCRRTTQKQRQEQSFLWRTRKNVRIRPLDKKDQRKVPNVNRAQIGRASCRERVEDMGVQVGEEE